MSELLSIKEYDLAAGVPLTISKPGTFFQIMESTYNVDVELLRQHTVIGKGDAVPDGFSYGPASEEGRFHGVRITSASAQSVKICIAREMADLKRIVGDVNADLIHATLGSASRAADNRQCFTGEESVINPLPSTYAIVQLWNPAGSGVDLVCTYLKAQNLHTATVPFQLFTHTAALTGITNEYNRYLGGAAPLGEVRSQNNVAAPLPGVGNITSIPRVVADGVHVFTEPTRDPWVIPPGNGLYVGNQTFQADIWVLFEWWERAAS